MAEHHIELNGAPASADDLRAIALVNYGQFTSMQVQDGCVRGLDLHLDRLDHATRELFGCPLDVERTRGWMRRLVGDRGSSLSLRVNVFSRALNRARLDVPAAPDVLVAADVARTIIAPVPLRVRSVRYEREVPHIKHVGTFGLFRQKRLVQAQGYDDALFVDASGAISEGMIWNVGFFDGERIVWPNAPALTGISMQLLKRSLQALGIEQLDSIGEDCWLGAPTLRAIWPIFLCRRSSPASLCAVEKACREGANRFRQCVGRGCIDDGSAPRMHAHDAP